VRQSRSTMSREKEAERGCAQCELISRLSFLSVALASIY